MTAPLARNALLLGNFVTGTAVLAPAGMLNELAAGLDVSLLAAGWLVTFGAAILCFASPLLAWATTRVERRTLLTAVLAVSAVGHFASALAPDYAVLLAARIALLVFAAVYTPQAASTIALIVPEKDRPGAIGYVFIGWSLAVAVGLPMVTLLAAQFGWRAAYFGIALLAVAATILNAVGLPRGLKGVPLSVASWIEVARNRQILLLLLITVLVIAGTFQVFSFLGPLLTMLADAGPQTIGLTFAISGVIGLIGNVVTTRIVGRVGPYRMSLILIATMVVGLAVWSLGTGVLAVLLLGSFLSAIGFAASNSIQQARLSMAAPALSSASIALNTSGIYVGQAIGSGVAGFMIEHGLAAAVGIVATVFTAAAIFVVLLTRNENAGLRSP
jgi:MFS transporter, DHA1 family, inner membrane transport protein